MFRPERDKIGNSRDKVVTLDPENLQEDQARLLSLLLRQQRNNKVKVIEKYREYTVTLGNEVNPRASNTVRVVVTNTLVYRAKKIPGSKKKRPRYSVVSNKVRGAGDFGAVYEVSGTLVHRLNGKMVYKSQKHRVVKVQEHSSVKPIEIAKNEAELSCLVPYMHAKKLTVLKDNSGYIHKSFMVEKLFAGETLDKILSNDKYSSPLSVDTRLKISINLLRVLQQLHSSGIVHRDLKTQNIIVDLATCEVSIIDLGLSRKCDRQDNRYSGNMAYKAPEAITKKYPYDQNSDIYSMGLILAEVWNAQPRDAVPWHSVQYVTKELYADREVANLTTLFSRAPELTLDQKSFLETAMRSMIEIKPSLRCSLRTALQLFEKVGIQRRLTGQLATDQQVRDAHDIAVETGLKLKEVELKLTQAKLEEMAVTQEAVFLPEIRDIVFTALDRIVDSKDAIKEFVAVLEYKLLHECDSKTEIKRVINAELEKFDRNYQFLINFRQSHSCSDLLSTSDLVELMDDVDESIYKCHKHSATLINIVEFNNKMDRQIENLKNASPDYLVKITPLLELQADNENLCPNIQDMTAKGGLIKISSSAKNATNVSNTTSGFFSRSKLCSRSIDLIENYRRELPDSRIVRTP